MVIDLAPWLMTIGSALVLVGGVFSMAQYARQTQLKTAAAWRPSRLSIATVHAGLPEPEPWDESRWCDSHPDRIYGGSKTGAYPMVFQLKDGPDPLDEIEIVPGRELGEFPNLHAHMSREQLVTATGPMMPDPLPPPPPPSPRKRFEEQTFTVRLPRQLVAS